MFCEVLHGTFSSNISLEEETQHGKHCKSTILNLLHLQECSLIRILCQAQWVKRTTRVKLVIKTLPIIQDNCVIATILENKVTLPVINIQS